MRKHDLKTWPEYFKEVQAGTKTFEVRKDDRNFQVGDILELQEYDPKANWYTGNFTLKQVCYKLSGGSFGVEKGFCVLGLR